MMRETPISPENEATKESAEIFYKLTHPDKAIWKFAQEVRPIQVDIEITDRCKGGCLYCFSNSTDASDTCLNTERLLRLLDELCEMGIRQIHWTGGDPLLHPDIFEIVRYGQDKGLRSSIFTSGLMITRKMAKRLYDSGIRMMGLHLDTINQEIYNQVNSKPQTLKQKIEGYYTLLEAGFSGDRVIWAFITMTKPVVETIEETIDWLVDKMGTRFIDLLVFKPGGLGGEHREWEPTLSEVKRAMEYRARKLGSHWLRIGPMECGMFFCRTQLVIDFNGNVLPCGAIPHYSVGNIYQEPIKDIIEKHRDKILWNMEIKGICSNCSNNDVCFGCRAHAYHYLGDMQASDPKCWLNPEAKETHI